MRTRLSGSLASRPDASTAKGAFYFSTAVEEIFTVDFTTKTGANVAGKAFTAADADGAVYFWFNTGASIDPAPGGRGIEVAVGAGNNATTLATALAAIVDSAFTFSRSGVVVTVTNVVAGARTNAGAGDSGLTVTTTQAGVNDAAAVYESDGVGWLERSALDHSDVVDQTEGLESAKPSAASMLGWVYYSTDNQTFFEAFPTGWFTLPSF